MDRILFGDNQFFGVNHMSEEKARSQAIKFQDLQAIIKVLDCAYEEGLRTFMCTTHERIRDVCDHIRANPSRYADFKFYPCMPYAHKYANAVTEHGMIGALKHSLPEGKIMDSLFKGGVSVMTKDIEGIGQLLIDAEMAMFKDLNTPVIFLQNVVTDLLLGINFIDAFHIFAEHVKTKYNAEPGFITMNLPRLIEALEQVGIENPIVCTNFNKIGFRMCGGIDAYEHTVATKKCRPIAMSVFASGAIPPTEALSYISEIDQIRSIVFGASSRANIRNTIDIIGQLDKSMAPIQS